MGKVFGLGGGSRVGTGEDIWKKKFEGGEENFIRPFYAFFMRFRAFKFSKKYAYFWDEGV